MSDARSILPLLRCDVHTSWSTTVHASDASPFGIGVCGRTSPLEKVARYGRQHNKGRFIIPDHVSARKAALGIDSKAPLSTLISSADFLELDDSSFVDIPKEFCDAKKQKIVTLDASL